MAKYNRQWQYLYNDQRWIQGRLMHLAVYPLCEYCLQIGKTTPAIIVDHIKPHKGDRELFFDHDNWQSLCKPCHDGPKALEESRGTLPGCSPDGIPLDRNHPWNEEE